MIEVIVIYPECGRMQQNELCNSLPDGSGLLHGSGSHMVQATIISTCLRVQAEMLARQRVANSTATSKPTLAPHAEHVENVSNLV